MADAVSTFTVRGTANVDDAVKGLQRVGDAAGDAGDASAAFQSQIRGMSTGLINAEDAATLLTTATNGLGTALAGTDAELRNMGNAADSAASGVNSLNDNVQLLAQLGIAETVKSIGGSFMELSGHLRAVEDGFRATAESIKDQFIKQIVEAGAALASFGSTAFEVAGTGLELGAALAQIVSILPQLGTITAGISAGFVAAKTAIIAFASAMTVATAGIAAGVIALGYGIERYIAYRNQVALTDEALAESARQTERNRETLSNYFTTFSDQTDQALIMADIQEQAGRAQNEANTYIARAIALRAEELGSIDLQIDMLEKAELLNEAKMAFMETEESQLQIIMMLNAGISEQEVASELNLRFAAEAANLTTNELRTWLATLPAINEELEYTEETSRNVFDLYSRLLSSFIQGDPSEEATAGAREYSSAIREQVVDIEGLIRARNALEESLDTEFARVTEDDTTDVRIAREDMYIQATTDQQAFLLQLWSQQDEAQALFRQNELIAQETERNELQAHLDEMAAITADRMERDESVRAAELASYQAHNQLKMDLLFGGGDFSAMSQEFQGQISEMSENGASSLGVLNSAMQDMAVGFMSSMTSAITSGERVDKALKKALSGMLKSLGSTYVAQGTALMIPPPYNPLGNPAAGKVMLGVGAGMLALGMAFGGGEKPSGGGGGGGGGGGERSVGESSGIMPAENTRKQGPLNLIDYTGVTIVTNDTDSMRTLINQTSRTEQFGGNSRV